jgi:hypothetical protein
MRGVSGGDPEVGARSGVPRCRLATAAPGGRAPRPTTRVRGARCIRSGPCRKRKLRQAPGERSAARGQKSPRWSAERRASSERRGRLTRALGVPQGTLRRCTEHRNVLSALRHPSFPGARSKKQNLGAKNAPRERDGLFEMVKWNQKCVLRTVIAGLDPAIHSLREKASFEERWTRGSSPRVTVAQVRGEVRRWR